MSEDERFLVFGSVAEGPRKDVGDIDLVVPEFADDRMYGAQVCLERYERLAEATGKPIDLFFTAYPEDFNLAAVYTPGQTLAISSGILRQGLL
jgi:predicted nucleotidyltransferase